MAAWPKFKKDPIDNKYQNDSFLDYVNNNKKNMVYNGSYNAYILK